MAATLPQSRKTNLMMGLRLKVCYTFRLHCRHWSSWQGFDLLMGSSLAGAEVSKCTRRTAEWGRQRERETTVVIKVAVSAATAADLRHSLALSSACLSVCLSVCLPVSLPLCGYHSPIEKLIKFGTSSFPQWVNHAYCTLWQHFIIKVRIEENFESWQTWL